MNDVCRLCGGSGRLDDIECWACEQGIPVVSEARSTVRVKVRLRRPSGPFSLHLTDLDKAIKRLHDAHVPEDAIVNIVDDNAALQAHWEVPYVPQG